MEELAISITSVVVATLANFFVGFLWYTVLFGKAWAKEMGMPMDQRPAPGAMVKSLFMNLVGCFLLAWVFAHNNAAWSYVPGMDQMSPVGSISSAAIFTWLGFFVPVDINTVAWEGKSWKLFFINTSYHFAMVLVSAIALYML